MRTGLLFLLLTTFISASAETGKVTGTVFDSQTEEGLVAANVTYGETGVVTDVFGDFEIELPYGTYEFKVSYVGYEVSSQTVIVDKPNVNVSFKMKSIMLEETVIQTDIAIDRKTPVAFSNIPAKQLQEELASRDIPLVLNSIPGVYATSNGGGDGDARINIRGFKQNYIGVMLDGVPVNDMENGWVYWSNWFGLDAITKTIQVQRGLGASKLALPSVGGTVNIITKGIGSERNFNIKQEFGSGLYTRTTLGFTSGRLDNGFGVTLAGSFKRSDGYVDETYSQGFFYYAKLEKSMGNHVLGISAFGAPQEHGQRPFKEPIGYWDWDFAEEQGIDSSDYIGLNRGTLFNNHWGYLQREGDSESKPFHTRKNFYHKPQFSLRHSWNASDKLYISNTLYASIGNGGGTGRDGNSFPTDSLGQLDIQRVYDINRLRPSGEAKTIIRASVNNHYWFGALSTFGYDASSAVKVSGGIDLRTYKGEHYREVYDLLGGQYFIDVDNSNANRESRPELKEGEKYAWHYDGLVRWGGIFGLVEYQQPKWSAFINLTGSASAYKKVNYFNKMDVEVSGENFEQIVGFGDTLAYDGNNHAVIDGNSSVSVQDGNYTVINGSDTTTLSSPSLYTTESSEANFSESDWLVNPGYTIKTGLNYNIDEKNSIFVNLGYLSRVPLMDALLYRGNVEETQGWKNERIMAAELGYNYTSGPFKLKLNTYYTSWENKPLGSPVTVPDPNDPENRLPVGLTGIDALHRGAEVDIGWAHKKWLEAQLAVSFGDWIWNSAEDAIVYNDEGDSLYTFQFDAKGVHVGDAAQSQLMASLTFKPIRGLYIRPKATFYARNFGDFDPESLTGENSGRESWEAPSYTYFDLFAGYGFNISKMRCNISGAILNVLDTRYIADARNNDPFGSGYADFDAKSASVFFGLGRRYNISIKVNI